MRTFISALLILGLLASPALVLAKNGGQSGSSNGIGGSGGAGHSGSGNSGNGVGNQGGGNQGSNGTNAGNTGTHGGSHGGHGGDGGHGGNGGDKGGRGSDGSGSPAAGSLSVPSAVGTGANPALIGSGDGDYEYVNGTRFLTGAQAFTYDVFQYCANQQGGLVTLGQLREDGSFTYYAFIDHAPSKLEACMERAGFFFETRPASTRTDGQPIYRGQEQP